MNFSTYRFTLDLQKHKSQMSIVVFQYDTAIKLSIGLTDGGVPYRLDGNITAKLYGKKPNGGAIVHDCSIEDSSRIIYTFEKTTANEIGITNCQICIYNNNDEQVSAPKFTLVVGEKAVNDDDVFEDEEFEGKYSALDAIFTAEAERVEAEAERVEAEEVRKNELLRKVDKTTEANKLYGTDEAGNPTTYDFDSMRGEKGEDGYTPQVGVDYFTETEKKELVSVIETQCKETLDKKLDKTTEANKIYGTDANGNQTSIYYSPSANPYNIVRRNSNGDVIVPDMPISDSGAPPKKYVDGIKAEAISHANSLNSALSEKQAEIAEKQTALEERVTDLESLTLTYIEDGSTAYEKSVPADVGMYARIKGIGGASEKVILGKNLINPADILMPEEVDSYTINADGTITYTINNSPSGFAFIMLNNLPVGRYYLYVDGIYDGMWNFYSEEYSDTPNIELYVMSDFDDSLNDYLPTTRTLKVMLWRDESVTTDTWEVVEAPSGTVFEPYHEPYFVNAEVERIESLGKNRLPSDVMIASNWVVRETAPSWSDYSFELEDGWYCISLKLKEEHKKNIYYYLYKSVNNGDSYTTANVGYGKDGVSKEGYLVTDNGIYNCPLWFKVDKKAGIIYRLGVNNISQSKLDMIYDLQIERVELEKEPSSSYKPSVYAPATEYVPYSAEHIDTFVIPEAVRNKDGYGREGSYIEVKDGKFTLTVTKDETLQALAEPIVTDITNLFTTNKIKLSIVRRGVLRFVTSDKIPVPSSVWFSKRKE